MYIHRTVHLGSILCHIWSGPLFRSVQKSLFRHYFFGTVPSSCFQGVPFFAGPYMHIEEEGIVDGESTFPRVPVDPVGRWVGGGARAPRALSYHRRNRKTTTRRKKKWSVNLAVFRARHIYKYQSVYILIHIQYIWVDLRRADEMSTPRIITTWKK